MLCFYSLGGGEREQVLYYERKVSDLLPDKWRLYSLGTNRNELFSVDRSAIIIPSKAEDLEELGKKFFDEQMFTGVISDAPLSIVASLGGAINDETQINAAVLRLKELKNRILMSNLNQKRKCELLDEVAAALKDFEGKSCITAINETTINLVRKILNKEVFNG